MITYCTNIHPGETWDDTFQSLARHLPVVKSAVSPTLPFPVGLRLSHRAASEISQSEAERFRDWLRGQDLFIPTINGFPYGTFHARPLKEEVYLPDWRQPERADYTIRLATLLDALLPDGMVGSISSVPVCFGRRLLEDECALVRHNLLTVLERLDRLRQGSGKTMVLALEPEPGCFLETTEDVVAFFDRLRIPAGLREGLGICFDCCHQAIQFEDPAVSLVRLAEAGIPIGKVQVSSALRMGDPERSLLERFCDATYLHQTVIRDAGGGLSRYRDLPEALDTHRARPGDEWRVHFHLPVFVDHVPPYGTTQSFLTRILPELHRSTLLEVETYTWEVLPPEFRTEQVDQSIIRELQWLKGVWNEANGRS